MGKYYWRLFWRYMHVSWLYEIAYPLNYWMYVVSEVVFFAVNLGYIYFLFEAGGVEEIVGFSVYDFYFVFALSDLIGLFGMAFVIPSTVKMKGEIHDGRYDFVILRPNSWFITNVRRSWIFGNLLSIVYSGLLILYVSSNLSIDLLSMDGLYVLLLLGYSFVLYSLIYWITALICLYIPRFDILQGAVNMSNDVIKYPRKVFPGWLQVVYRTVLPMFLVVNPIYDLMEGSLSGDDVVNMILILIMFLLLVGFMWKDGLRRYESAA